ncbi:PqiC family protein [Thiopseudomonas denitrificans]|uniref:ABC-type transport auxiliary lipoprotein component domain-containing protein n=1 Tax=Thiopseudomonas denitrificans TaxID=1501432 RepID=A0A4R6TXK1_9GAMM|nr:ABC-type transport auxiliary lipoprotein family protein [Thiopseudomonas denitrificans]TDQ37512.1 hypothetical protein DFQ45_10716 [Thiopseudomonas denitrificans]
MNKLTTLYRPFHLILASAIALGAGCSLVAPGEFYQLQAPAEASTSVHADLAVLLGPVKLADYLQREQILQRQPDGRLTASRNGRWAGNLEDEVGQLLLRQMAMRLGSSHVALYPDRVGVKAGAQIVLSISRLDSGEGEPAVLEAQWRLLDTDGEVRDSRVVTLQAAHEDQLASQVRAQSELLVQLSEQLAGAVRQLQDNSRKVAKAQPARGQENRQDSLPQERGIPMAEPLPELEVYRF